MLRWFLSVPRTHPLNWISAHKKLQNNLQNSHCIIIHSTLNVSNAQRLLYMVYIVYMINVFIVISETRWFPAVTHIGIVYSCLRLSLIEWNLHHTNWDKSSFSRVCLNYYCCEMKLGNRRVMTTVIVQKSVLCFEFFTSSKTSSPFLIMTLRRIFFHIADDTYW